MMLHKIISIQSPTLNFQTQDQSIAAFIAGDLLLDRKETKLFLSQFPLEKALDILWKQQENQREPFIYLFEKDKEPIFYPLANSKIPYLLNYISNRPLAAKPLWPAKPIEALEHNCALCAGYRGGKNYIDPIERQKWKQSNKKRVLTIALENGQKFTAFANHLPTFENHFVLAKHVGKENKHTPWQMDLPSMLKLVEKFSEYQIAQNPIFGASVPNHSHFHIFKYQAKTPVEQTQTTFLKTSKIGSQEVSFYKCDFPISTYKISIQNTLPKIDDQVISHIQSYLDYFKNLNPNHHYSLFARNLGNQIDIYVSLIESTYDKINQKDPALLEPTINFRSTLGFFSVYTKEELREWQNQQNRLEKHLKFFSPQEKNVEQFEKHFLSS